MTFEEAVVRHRIVEAILKSAREAIESPTRLS